ncbi:hypothetical protein C1646_751205 [Rhizophagus diaphanus]|nr:hypothetical protein C1646_751205 [Rhizophagus diaphanus] [Rhizophagus sp. MUCL 43196]
MSQLLPEDKSSNSENEANLKIESGSFSELDQRFSFKISWKRTKHRYSPYIIPLEYSLTLENITMQFLETIPINALKDGLVALKSMTGGNYKHIIIDIDKQKLTAVLLLGSLNIKLIFYMSEKNFIEMEQKRFEDNPYILRRLPADDNSNNNTTIGIELLYQEKTGKNFKKDILAVACKKYIKNLQEYFDNYLSKGVEFDSSKINRAIPFMRNIDDDNLNLRINSIPNNIDGGNISLLIEEMLVVLDEIKSENEITKLLKW